MVGNSPRSDMYCDPVVVSKEEIERHCNMHPCPRTWTYVEDTPVSRCVSNKNNNLFCPRSLELSRVIRIWADMVPYYHFLCAVSNSRIVLRVVVMHMRQPFGIEWLFANRTIML